MLNSLTVEQSRQIQVQILFEQPSATRIPTKLPLASQTQQEGGDMWLAEALYKKRSKWWAVNRPICGCSLTVKPRSSKPAMWFRLPSFAPIDFEQTSQLLVKEICAMTTEDSESGFVEFSIQFYREPVQLLLLIL